MALLSLVAPVGLTGAAAAAPEAEAPLACVLLYEIHDVSRTYLCADAKGDCKAYVEERGWHGTERNCLHPQGVHTSEVNPFPFCQQVFVGPDIDQGVCVDTRSSCWVLWYDTYGTGGGDRCLVSKPVTAASEDCSASCIENCIVMVENVALTFGCTVLHKGYYGQTNCYGPCDWTIAKCQFYTWNAKDGCDFGDSRAPEKCHQVLVGPEIDQGVCVDLASDCWVLWYNEFGPDRCIVGKPVTA